ncbi:MAG: hypothetical protein M1820_007174 [Bogoriella megaspora]|nr:MAG: hypothetical protein M1820_007174 [Bogoriella megaspora]
MSPDVGDQPSRATKDDVPITNGTDVVQEKAMPKQIAPQLCQKCQDLELRVDKFVISSSMPQADHYAPSDFPLTSSTSPLDIGTFRDIYTRSCHGCPFCDLFVRSVCDGTEAPNAEKTQELVELHDARCLVSWQLDGCMIKASAAGKNQSVRGLTRRIHLGWKDKRLKDAYLVFVARERYTITPSDAQKVWGKEQLFIGRRIDTDGGTQARIRSWLDLCRNQHRGPCNRVDRDTRCKFRDMVSHSFFGVVDVQNMQLVALPVEKTRQGSICPPFAALSYVWGRTLGYVTKTENVPLLRMQGGIEKVLRQLPTVIVDAIDLTRRLGLQYIWIDALYGEDASVGLRAMRMNEHNGDQQMADCAPGVRLIVSRPPEMYIKASKWNTRAWTFQERLLSNRCVIFTAGRVYFQCWSLDFVDAPMRMFRQLPQRAFWVYTKVLTLYTDRDLTKLGDILAAFSGMRNLMANIMNAPFIFGLPSSHFDLALLWQHLMPVTRRLPKHSGNESDKKVAEFPSWCWSGWRGAPAAYLNDMVGDCLGNVHEWLNKRTWVKWHIRDGRGDLRPLWDNRCGWELDKSEDERWKGYKTERSAWPTREMFVFKYADEPRYPLDERGSGRSRSSIHKSRVVGEDCRRLPVSNSVRENREDSSPYRHSSAVNRRKVSDSDPEDDPFEQSTSRGSDASDDRRSRRQRPNREISRQVVRRNGRDGGSNVDYGVTHEREDSYRGAPAQDYVEKHNSRYEDVPRDGWDRLFRKMDVLPGVRHTSEFFDQFFDHGCYANPEAMQANPIFNITLREYPYSVEMAPFSSEPEDPEYPLMPILQFWTYHTSLYIRSTTNTPSK